MADFDDDNLKDYDDTSTDGTPAREISADLIRGHINTIILRTLTDGEKYGTEIIEEIERKSHGQYIMKQPTLYSALKRLESQGFVTSYWGGVSNGGRRRYFNLTALGREEAEKNIDEWEYSRTIIDCLISSRYFDLSAAREGIREDNYDDVAYGDDLDGDDSPAFPIAEEEEKEEAPEENENMYSPSLPYFSHADEILNSTVADSANMELPISLLSVNETAPAKDDESEAPLPDEPVYEFDSSADEAFDGYIESESEEKADESPEEEVPLPEDTARIYLDVSDDYESADRDNADNIIEDVGTTFKSEPESAEEAEENEESEEVEESEGEDIYSETSDYGEVSTEESHEEEPIEEEYTEEENVSDEDVPAEESEEETEEKTEEESVDDGENERLSAAATLSDSEYRKIIRQSQIDRDYKKTLERIYASALTEENSVSDSFRPYESSIDYTEADYAAEDAAADSDETENDNVENKDNGEFKKIVEENPAIRQEDEDAYKIAGYQSQELFDEHYAKTERVNLNQGENDYSNDSSYAGNGGYTHPDQMQSEDENSYDDEYNPPEEERTFTRLPDDTSMPERENVSYTPGLIDVSDIIAEANADGIKISITSGARISASSAKKVVIDESGEKYSTSNPRARVKAALIVLAIAIAEAVAVFINMSYLKVIAAYPIIMIVIPLFLVIISAAVSARSDGAESKTLSAARGITAAIVIFMICVLAICAISIATNVTLEDGGEILSYIVIPSVYSLNTVVYAAAYYGFAKQNK